MEWYDFWAWVEPVSGSDCWEYSKPNRSKQFGRIEKKVGTYRKMVFEDCVGIDSEEQVGCICRNPNCVRPTHLSYFRGIRKLYSRKT